MLAGIFAGLLKFVSKGMLDGIFRHLETQAKTANDRERLKNEFGIEMVKAELSRRQQSADLIKASLSHRIMWFPAFVICLDAAILFTAHVVDAVWQLPGDVASLDATMAGVFGMALTYMFLKEK